MPLLRNKPLLLIIIIAVTVMIVFWQGSRYPDLDQKALMGGETQLAVIGFETLIDVPVDASVITQIIFNTINWLYTNWRGMTFGLLLGALLLTLLPLIQRYSFKSRIGNSLFGMLMGSPLGVCVNCAAPIAQGIFAAGGRTEMALAAMFSSPTLNIVVLTMLFSLFPIYMVVTKIVLTILFILLGIPLLMRLLPIPEEAHLNKLPQQINNLPLSALEVNKLPDTWYQAITWVGGRLAQNLWYIVRTTVPLMILAGALGSAAVTLLPFEAVAELLPTQGRLNILVSMIALAFFGLFLPVPMAFDVIVTAVLLQAGLPVFYAMVLLFTLGIFSVYPFFLIWRGVSKAGALSLLLLLAAISIIAGFSSHKYQQWDFERQDQFLIQRFANEPASPKQMVDRSLQGIPQGELLPKLQKAMLTPELHIETSHLQVMRLPFESRSGSGQQQFTQVEASQLGINEHDNFSYQKFAFRLAKLRGIAAGDIHNDGWPDIVVSSDTGIGLYANRQGAGYEQQQLDIPELNTAYIAAVALVDINNDDWLDLFFSTLGKGSYIVYNREGSFTSDNLHQVSKNVDSMHVNAPAFADIDKNGELDIVLGNATIGNVNQQASLDAARNLWLKQVNQKFHAHPLPSIAGETLTILLADLNQDDWPDLIVGNEFRTSDAYYVNNKQAGFDKVTSQKGMFPYTGRTTMSLTSADIDNDLVPEIFLGQRAWEHGSAAPQTPKVICQNILDSEARKNCVRMLKFRDVILQTQSSNTVFGCLVLDDRSAQNGCLAHRLLNISKRKKDEDYCNFLVTGWPILANHCFSYFDPVTPPTALELADELPQVMRRNILFKRDTKGVFQDIAANYGLQPGGWSWNAKFADLDNDGWQDLYIATGDLTVRLRHTNLLFQNKQGKGFENITVQSGLHSYLDTLAYTYTDMDNDGDLDIITVPAAGPIAVYVNNNQQGNAIAFELRDDVGNRFGIGSKITIYYGDGQQQMRELQASGGYLSFDAPTVHFGLGEVDQIKRLEIQWSTGNLSQINQPLPAGSRYIITHKRQDKN